MMRRWAAYLLVPTLALAWGGCASVQENKLLPVMGMADSSEEEEEISATTAKTPQVEAESSKEEEKRTALAVETPRVEADSVDVLGQTLLFMPFKDNSKYKGPWNIYASLPRSLEDTLGNNDFFHTIPIDSALVRLKKKELKGHIPFDKGLEIGRELGSDFVIFGEIDELSMKRFRATVPVGGYRSYQGVTGVTLRLVKVIDRQPAGEMSKEAEVDSKRYGITNPAAFVPLEKEYFLLSQMEFGSEEFRQTLLGMSVGKCMTELAAGLDSLIKPPPELTLSKPQIIAIDGAQAYINVGLIDSLQNGNKFGVWDHGRELTDPQTGELLGNALPRRVGVVQVEQVLSEHLSLVRILEGQDQIRREYDIRAE